LAFILLFLLLPFAYICFGVIYKGQEYFLFITALVFAAAKVKAPLLRGFIYYVAIYVVVALVQSMMSYRNQSEYIALSVPIISATTCFWLAAAIFAYVHGMDIKTGTILNLICISAIIQAALGICQHFGFDPFYAFIGMVVPVGKGLKVNEVTGSLGNPNYLAAYLAFSAPFFMRGKWKWCLILMVPVFWWARTSTALIALSVGAFVYFKGWWRLPAIAGAVLYAALVDSNVWLENARFEWRLDNLGRIFGSPVTVLFGFGPGAHWGHSYLMHNEWLTLWFQYGLIGVFPVLAWFVWKIAIVIKSDVICRMVGAALAIVAVNALGNHPFHIPTTAMLALVIMSLAEREIYLTEPVRVRMWQTISSLAKS